MSTCRHASVYLVAFGLFATQLRSARVHSTPADDEAPPLDERLIEVRDAARQAAFAECQRLAKENVMREAANGTFTRTLVRKSSPTMYELRRLRPGATVRIWALKGKADRGLNTFFRKRNPFDSTYPTHLNAEIVVPQGPNMIHYSVGFTYTEDEKGSLNKPETSAYHIVSQETGEVLTPDINFHIKIQKQLKHPDADMFELYGIGELKQDHIDTLDRWLKEAKEDVKLYKGPTYGIRTPDLRTYRELSIFSSVQKRMHNCASFILTLFGDIVQSTSLFSLYNPAAVGNRIRGDESFGGCNANGLILKEKDVVDSINEETLKRTRHLSTAAIHVAKRMRLEKHRSAEGNA
eukprot:TRINITY_DN24099_c0_g2_i1.p1 TRINITY_DN24099_c0_g2~~TRINITY_DN24099_c0_g2_i1.p1  ORF type:complete len:369 (+),score=50.53 TRINITY_DN24099_c0_g2_i1:60-1109(+)